MCDFSVRDIENSNVLLGENEFYGNYVSRDVALHVSVGMSVYCRVDPILFCQPQF